MSALPITALTQHGCMTLAHVSVNALLKRCARKTSSSIQRHVPVSAGSRTRVGKESTAILTTVSVSAATSHTVQAVSGGTIPPAAVKTLPRSDVLNALPTHIAYPMLAM